MLDSFKKFNNINGQKNTNIFIHKNFLRVSALKCAIKFVNTTIVKIINLSIMVRKNYNNTMICKYMLMLGATLNEYTCIYLCVLYLFATYDDSVPRVNE